MYTYLKEFNPFIRFIYEKEEKKFGNIIKYLFHISKLKKFKKTIYRGSPSFETLWQMAEFIKFAEIAFLYDNSLDSDNYIGLFSSKNYKKDENGFKIINSEFSKDCDITIKLDNKKSTVALAIEPHKNRDTNTKVLWFKNNQWMYENEDILENEILLDMSIDIINTCILELFGFCYYMRYRKRYKEKDCNL